MVAAAAKLKSCHRFTLGEVFEKDDGCPDFVPFFYRLLGTSRSVVHASIAGLCAAGRVSDSLLLPEWTGRLA